MTNRLTTTDHSRDVAGLKYVYPVISRRAGGLSIGINFNPNNACNWRCIYCQVPNLQRGNPPEMDFALLEEELRFFLNDVLSGDFFERFDVPPEQRVVKDIAISGNGEPTSLKDFDKAIRLIGEIATETGVFPAARFVLITNGSLIYQAQVQTGLKELARFRGELWFKLDSATNEGRKVINDAVHNQQKLLKHLAIATRLCPTKLQTCLFHYRDRVWNDQEKNAYLALLKDLSKNKIAIQQIMLYSIARQSLQPEASDLEKAELSEMNALAADIKALGYDVGVNP